MDLLHWAGREGCDFDLALERAREHYQSELDPSAGDDRGGLFAPWTLHFDRAGTEDIGVIRDSAGHDLASLPLIAAAGQLLEALDYLLCQTVDQDLKDGIALSEGEQQARAKALAAIALAKEGVA